MRSKIAGLAILVLAAVLGGCTSVHSKIDPTFKLGQLKRIYVEHRLSDGRHLDELIARELNAMGYEASAGPLTLIPMGTQVILEYEDTWTFDFTTYLIELDVALRDAKTGQEIGVARYFHPSLLGSNPVTVVDKTLKNLLDKR